MTEARATIPATLIPGDGIGPEIIDAAVLILDTLGAPFAWDVHQAGLAGIEAHGDPLPATTLASIRGTRLALKGPLATPSGGGYRSSNVRLREEFQLYANRAPCALTHGSRWSLRRHRPGPGPRKHSKGCMSDTSTTFRWAMIRTRSRSVRAFNTRSRLVAVFPSSPSSMRSPTTAARR